MVEKETSMITNISNFIIPSDDDFLPSKFSPRLKYLFIFFYSLVIFGSVSGNSVIIVVTLCSKAMHRVVNLFFVSLAISDTLVAMCNMPLQLEYYVSNEWKLGEAMCKITSYIQGVNIVTSIFTLTALATERYYAICQPLKARVVRSSKRGVAVICFLWCLAFVVVLPQCWIQRLEMRLSREPDNIPPIRIAHICAEFFLSMTHNEIYTYIFVFGIYVVPIGVMFYAYGKIIYILWVRKPVSVNSGAVALVTRAERNLQQKKCVIKMLVVVVLLFILCWLPFFAIQVYTIYHEATYIIRIYQAVFHLIGYSNSLLNPIMYGFINKSFRENTKRTLERVQSYIHCPLYKQKSDRIRKTKLKKSHFIWNK